MADLAEMDEEPAQLGIAEVLEKAVRTLKVWCSEFQCELNFNLNINSMNPLSHNRHKLPRDLGTFHCGL